MPTSSAILSSGKPCGTRSTSCSLEEHFPSPLRSPLHCFLNQNLCGSKVYSAPHILLPSLQHLLRSRSCGGLSITRGTDHSILCFSFSESVPSIGWATRRGRCPPLF